MDVEQSPWRHNSLAFKEVATSLPTPAISTPAFSEGTSSEPLGLQTGYVAGESSVMAQQLSMASSQPLQSGSSLINLPARRGPVVPKLPSQLPRVDNSCGTGNCYLPPAEAAQVLLQEYLHDYNSKIPLYSPESLYGLFRDCYAGAADDRPLAWVLVYTTIAMTYRLRAMSVFAAPDDTIQAEWYLNVCLTRLPDLLVQPPCIRLVQACISIAWLLETSGRCERAPFFASTALRLATELEYNDLSASSASSSTAEETEARYVFWLAFFIDTHFSFAEQRSVNLRVADINTPLPSESVINWWDSRQTESHGQQSSINAFALHCSLAVIEAEAAEQLCSIQARRQSSEDLDVTAGRILDKLAAWRQRNRLSHIDANDVRRLMYRSDVVLCIVLEAAYFRTLYLLQARRALQAFKEKQDVFNQASLRSMMQVSSETCVNEARRFLQLSMLMPQGNVSTTW